jgi:gamma-glutamylcyclotransferase (GGCT)/AIG2-like uncharacterized protein YtfP
MNKNFLNEDKILFATYGTLKVGRGNSYLLNDAKYLGTHQTNADYTMYDGGYPIVEREGTTPIHIEVYEAKDKETIKNIFSLEGCTGVQGHKRNWYDFDEVDTPFGKAVMFVMDKGKGGRQKIVANGNW